MFNACKSAAKNIIIVGAGCAKKNPFFLFAGILFFFSSQSNWHLSIIAFKGAGKDEKYRGDDTDIISASFIKL